MNLIETNPETKTVRVTQEESPRYQLTLEDLRRLGGRFGIYILGAIVIFVAENLPNVDFGVFTPVVVPVVGLILDAIRRFITEQKYLVK